MLIRFINQEVLTNNKIIVSNEISDRTIISLNQQENYINVYAIGTKLVTCAQTPALGMVYKLVEINGEPRIKISQDIEKTTIPCKRNIFRIYDESGKIILDYMTKKNDLTKNIDPNGNMICKHPFDSTKEIIIDMTKNTYKPLLHYIWKNGKATSEDLSIQKAREYNELVLTTIHPDVLKYENPIAVQVYVDFELFQIIQNEINKNLNKLANSTDSTNSTNSTNVTEQTKLVKLIKPIKLPTKPMKLGELGESNESTKPINPIIKPIKPIIKQSNQSNQSNQ